MSDGVVTVTNSFNLVVQEVTGFNSHPPRQPRGAFGAHAHDGGPRKVAKKWQRWVSGGMPEGWAKALGEKLVHPHGVEP